MLRKKLSRFDTIARFVALVICFVMSAFDHAVYADSSAESAFYFAGKREWDEALEHARQSNERELTHLMTWLAILDTGYSMPAASIQDFITKKPYWPEARKMQLRFEQAYAEMPTASDAFILKWFEQYPPISGAGKWVKAQALLASNPKNSEAATLIKDAWVYGDFTSAREQEIISKAGAILTPNLHKQRAERLMWEGQFTALKRMQPYIPKDFMDMLQARIALEALDKKAPAMVAMLPKSLQNNAGLIYSRLVWRMKKKDDKGAVAMLLQAPKKPPYAEKWWRWREVYIRRAIDEKNFALASKLLQAHGLEKGVEFAEAAWLKGWLDLEFRHKPKDAYQEFDKLYRGVNYGVSKSRAAYWAGRAAEALGDKEIALEWYKNAAFYPTTFYGQLAFAKVNPKQKLALPPVTAIDAKAYQSFKQTDMARAIALCMQYNRPDIATRFINGLIDESNSKQIMMHVAALAREQKGTSLGVKAAKRALQYNVFLGDVAYPILTKTHGVLEAALTHAITRQESEFNPKALSPAGAVGLMQLLPSTAKEVAAKNNYPYQLTALVDEDYNTLLGSTYLASLIRRQQGSYVLAIASYNAGPGRVNQWIGEFGRPQGSVEDVVNWIEKIPYAETRNYVQRVMENLQVYRVILGGDNNAALQIGQDLKR